MNLLLKNKFQNEKFELTILLMLYFINAAIMLNTDLQIESYF
jgi:hypothetical protein